MKKRAKTASKAKAGAAKRSRAVKTKTAARSIRSARAATRAKPRAGGDVKKLVHRWFDELWNRRNGDAIREMMDPAAVGSTEGGTITGHDDFVAKLHQPLLGAFPDFRVRLDDVITDGDDAAVRWTFEATHGGDTLGVPASNRRVRVSGMTWMRFKNGKLVAGWDRWNAGGLLAHLRDGSTCATVEAIDAAAPATAQG